PRPHRHSLPTRRSSDLDNVDTSTALTAAFSGNNARSAVSVDGTAFWAGGAGSGTGAGMHYIGFGMTGGTQVLSLPASVRAPFILDRKSTRLNSSHQIIS